MKGNELDTLVTDTLEPDTASVIMDVLNVESIKSGNYDEAIAVAIQKGVDMLLSMGARILFAILAFVIGRWIINRLKLIFERMLQRRNVEISLSTFLRSLVNISLTFFLIIIVIGILGIETSSFIALFASAGVAVGMALSGTLQNFAGGVMILLFKPFKVGDYLETQGISGTVKEIQIFNTIINTVDNKVIIVPNGGLSTGIITNYSKEDMRRVDWTFSIGYGDSYDRAKVVLIGLIDADKRILKEPEPFIALKELNNSSVDIVVRVWVKASDYWSVFFDMNEIVYRTFDKEGLNIPFPQMDVHLHQKID